MSTAKRKPLKHYLDLRYPFNVYTDSEDVGFVIVFPDLPGCFTQAETADQIGPMADEARQIWIEGQYEDGREIPLPTHYESFSGRFNLRLPKSLHRELSQAAERDGASLNQYVVMLLAGRQGQGPAAEPQPKTSRVAEPRATYAAKRPRRKATSKTSSTTRRTR